MNLGYGSLSAAEALKRHTSVTEHGKDMSWIIESKAPQRANPVSSDFDRAMRMINTDNDTKVIKNTIVKPARVGRPQKIK